MVGVCSRASPCVTKQGAMGQDLGGPDPDGDLVIQFEVPGTHPNICQDSEQGCRVKVGARKASCGLH